MKNLLKICTALLMTTQLTGCLLAVAGAGAVGVDTVDEDRSAGTKFDDNAIALKINGRFASYDKDLASDTATDVIEGRVLLTGKVKFQEIKDKATKLAWQVDGVKEVINELKVTDNGSIGRYATDARISNQIRAKLLITADIRSSNYGVQTVDGVVYLMGIAQNDKEQQEAIEVCRRISGVARVVSHVILRNDPRRGDKAQPLATPAANNNHPAPAGETTHDDSDSGQNRDLPE